MKVEQVIKQVCRYSLDPGQVRRLPVDRARPLYGYYVTAPCGHSSAVMMIDGGVDLLVERDGILTAAQFPCDVCGRRVEIRDGEFVT